MLVGDALGNRQPQAAMALAAPGRIKALEGFNRLGEQVFGDTFPAIHHMDHEVVGGLAEQLHLHRRQAVGDGVVNQVGDGPAQGHRLNRRGDGLQLQLDLACVVAARELLQQGIERHLHKRFLRAGAGKQKELAGDALEGIEVGGHLGQGRPIEAQGRAVP